MKKPKRTHVWYSKKLDAILLGKWIKVKHYLFWTKDKYRIEFEDGSYSLLNSPKVLQKNCELIDTWDNNNESI